MSNRGRQNVASFLVKARLYFSTIGVQKKVHSLSPPRYCLRLRVSTITRGCQCCGFGAGKDPERGVNVSL
jgi:hypothetical protein